MSPEMGDLLRAILEGQKVIEAKLDSLEAKVNSLEAKVNSLEAKVNSLEAKVNSLEAKVGSLEARLDSLEVKVDALGSGMVEVKGRLRELRNRDQFVLQKIGELESEIYLLNHPPKP